MLCGEGRCLDERFVCDGTPDCGQGEDEVKIMMMFGMWLLGQRGREEGDWVSCCRSHDPERLQ